MTLKNLDGHCGNSFLSCSLAILAAAFGWHHPIPKARRWQSRKRQKVTRVDQLQAPNCYEKWKVRAGVQADSEDDHTSQSKTVNLTNNCPALRKSEIECYTMLAKAGVHHYSSNNTALGIVCGKYYRVCTLAITGPGDSAIIRRIPEQIGKKYIVQNFSLIKLASAWFKNKQTK